MEETEILRFVRSLSFSFSVCKSAIFFLDRSNSASAYTRILGHFVAAKQMSVTERKNHIEERISLRRERRARKQERKDNRKIGGQKERE